MGIQLVEADERNEVIVQGVTFLYRRMTTEELARIEKQCTSKGRTDWNKVSAIVLERCLYSWTGVTSGPDKTPVTFDPALIKKLPPDVKTELAEHFYASSPAEEEEKNLDPGSKDSTATGA